MNIWNRSTRIPEIYGTLIALGLIVYFVIMYAVGLLQVIELRLLNLFIMLAGVYFAMKQYARTHDGHLNYFRGLAIGVATSAIGSATFSLFLFVFLRFNNDLMQYIIEHEPMGPYLNAYIASFMVLLEGVFSGLFITFVLLNWVHSDQVNEPVGTSS
jgi:hypothetical protein